MGILLDLFMDVTYLVITLQALPGNNGDLSLTCSETQRVGISLSFGRHCEMDDGNLYVGSTTAWYSKVG